MYASLRRIDPRVVLVLALCVAVGAFSTAYAAPVIYNVILDGPSEAPPNASPGTGIGTVTIDAVAHTMNVNFSFQGLIGNVTLCHIHAPTAVALAGTAGVATTTPSFAGFPAGGTSGAYNNTLDETLASSWNPTYVTNNGGTTASAEAALFAAIAAGKAYLNVHTSFVPGGEIRGFLLPQPLATENATWGGIKALYR